MYTGHKKAHRSTLNSNFPFDEEELQQTERARNHLTELHINGINYFPQIIFQCSTLKAIFLNDNYIDMLPDNISNLVSMRQLSLSHNHVKTLPKSIGGCLMLTILQMDHNRLKRIPESIGNLSCLEKFDASSNMLDVLPSTFCRCNKLTYINMANNVLQALPLNIGNLEHVQHFDLQANKVSCLPLTFDRMRTLRKSTSKLVLIENPLIHPPLEVCLQLGMYGIHTYLKELRRSDAHKMNYQKLVLVGETMAGKTSLAQTLMNSSSQLTTDQQRTVVLEQHTWPAEGGLEIQINDFGGHEMYHLTSPCFFTPNVPYLLIFDIKKYTRQTHHKDIGCWIDIVRMKVPRATIRMVGTHQDECSSEEIGEKLQYIAQTVQNDEAKWKADITSQLDMIESNECLGDLARQHRQECLQTHLNNLPNLHEPDSPVEIRTVSSSDLGGIDSLSSDIRELCKQVGSNRQDTIPKIWFDLYEMLQGTEYDNQHFVHLDDLQPYLKELDELEALKLHEAPTQKLESESDDEFYMYEEESDTESDDDGDDTTGEELNVALKTQCCMKVPSCHYQETNAAKKDVCSKNEGNKNDANAHQPLVFPSDKSETVKYREESMCLAPVSKRLIAALHYLNAVGLITWYPDDEKLKNLIFHRPAKLVEIFKAIINHDIKKQLDFKDVVFSTVGQFSKQGFARAVQEFESTANLSVAIVRCLWHKLGFSKEDIESLIKLMIKFDICYEVLESKVAPGLQSSHSLHIPWYLSADPPQDLSRMWPQPPPDDYQQLTMQYHFPTFCPRGLFERASVRLHRHIAHRVNWKNGVWAEVDNRQILLTRATIDDESGREVVFNLSVRAQVTAQEPRHTDDISQLWKTFLSIHRDMQSLIQDWPGLRCDLFLQCAHCAKMGKDKPGLFPGEVLEQQCQQDVRTVPCPQYPVIFPVPKVSTDLVYPPKSCMEKEQYFVTYSAGVSSETSVDHASSPVSEMDRLHLGVDILQEVTALVQKKYPGISFVPSRDRQDEAQRTTTVREFHDQLSSRVQHFSSVTDYSIDYEDFPTITERMKSVCLLVCPEGTATGFLVGPKHVMTNYHFLQLYVEPALRTNNNPDRYTATFHFSSMQTFRTRFCPTYYLSYDAELDYAILELEHVPPHAAPLGQFVSELHVCHQDGVVIVVGHPGGQRKRVDFCPIAVVDQNFEVHIRNVRGIPDNPTDFPGQVAGRANYHTSSMFHGSSGSPGFDKSGNLVVMHTRGFFPYSNSPSIVEQGVLMTSIREHVGRTLGNDTRFSEMFPPQMMDIG
ncbi:PREDICTED: malignant fibrous histiocytoma-amplified sequence 1 homolog [Branchiostoma belcheri]|uniref:Malignant fibrous histiocytoma-amplified sequence 1 homolog n=1 Tax=Branchiostoma belcheri TaxID=7741 RepID=A0A6P5AIJ6_BRABE|nr:PREDICTED: malignant fibrous histiocytoma-amplified sequence 1 homolog [Branchiostoma belcheri]